MQQVLETILKLRQDRGWSEYQLAERSGLPQSTVSSWFRKNMAPSIPSLEKVCAAFGITLSQLFADGRSPVEVTPSQQELLDRWSRLTPEQQEVVFQVIEKMR